MQRLVCRYAVVPFQFRLIHQTNELKTSFTYKDKQILLRGSSIVYKKHACGGQITLGRLAGI